MKRSPDALSYEDWCKQVEDMAQRPQLPRTLGEAVAQITARCLPYEGAPPEPKGVMKLDQGKTDPTYLAEYFPRALLAIADICDYGFKKYGARGGWKKVDRAYERYSAAHARHDLAPAIEGSFDLESHFLHVAHRAWNALAVLELMLERGVPLRHIPEEPTSPCEE